MRAYIRGAARATTGRGQWPWVDLELRRTSLSRPPPDPMSKMEPRVEACGPKLSPLLPLQCRVGSAQARAELSTPRQSLWEVGRLFAQRIPCKSVNA